MDYASLTNSSLTAQALSKLLALRYYVYMRPQSPALPGCSVNISRILPSQSEGRKVNSISHHGIDLFMFWIFIGLLMCHDFSERLVGWWYEFEENWWLVSG